MISLIKREGPIENACIKFLDGWEVLHGRFLSESQKGREVSLEELLSMRSPSVGLVVLSQR
jgi:hypothetical protein